MQSKLRIIKYLIKINIHLALQNSINSKKTINNLLKETSSIECKTHGDFLILKFLLNNAYNILKSKKILQTKTLQDFLHNNSLNDLSPFFQKIFLEVKKINEIMVKNNDFSNVININDKITFDEESIREILSSIDNLNSELKIFHDYLNNIK